MKRLLICCDNVRLIRAHNERFNRNEVSYKLGQNKFCDITDEEFVDFHTGYRNPDNITDSVVEITPPPSLNRYLPTKIAIPEPYVPKNIVVPDAVDWRERGVIISVKDQSLYKRYNLKKLLFSFCLFF